MTVLTLGELIQERWGGVEWVALVLGVVLAALWLALRARRERQTRRSQLRAREPAPMVDLIADFRRELRTRLTLTLGPLQDLLEQSRGPLDVGVEGQIDLARRNAEAVLELGDRLFDVARLAAGSLAFCARRGDLVQFLHAALSRFNNCLAERQRIVLTFAAPLRSVELYFDPDHLDRLLTSLLTRVLQLTPAGATVALSVAAPADADTHVTVSLRADLPEQAAGAGEGIFDLLHLKGAVARPRRPFEGDFYLAVARQLAELHGGRLRVVSDNSSQTFILALRRGREHLTADQLSTDRTAEGECRDPAAGAAAANPAPAPPPPAAVATPAPESPPPSVGVAFASETTAEERRFLDRVRTEIEAHLDDEGFHVRALADRLGMDRSHLYRRLRALLDRTPSALLLEARLEQAGQRLARRDGSVCEISDSVGFKSVSHFAHCFHEQYEMTPSEYRERVANHVA